MAGPNDTRQTRGQGYSPAMPPIMGPPAPPDSAQARAEALRGVIPQVMDAARPFVPFAEVVRSASTPQARATRAAIGQELVGTAAGLVGATDAATAAFERAEAARAASASPAPARPRAAAAPTPMPQTRGQSLTEVALPPLTQQQIRANAAAQLSQYNVAELAALQGLIPARPEPISVEEQVRQTLFDRATANYLQSQRQGASVEEAAAGEAALIQQLMQILDPNALLVPTE